jgi:hypothetical protein
MFGSLRHESKRRRISGNSQQHTPVETLESRLLLSGEIFVTNTVANTVSEFSSSGTLLTSSFITGLDAPKGIAISGSDLFIANSGNGTIGEYTTSGTTVNAALISGLNQPDLVAVAGAALFVSNGTGGIGEYSTTGATGNALLLGFQQPIGIATLGTDVIVSDAGATATDAYDFSDLSPEGTPDYLFTIPATGSIAATPSGLFLGVEGEIAEYTTAGSLENGSLVSIPGKFAAGVAVSGTNLFALQQDNQGAYSIGQYTTSGGAGDSSFITGLSNIGGLTVDGAGAASTVNQLAIVDQPSGSGTGGALSQVKVYVEDADGNLVTSDNSSVTIVFDQSSGIGPMLKGTATVSAVGGVATFNGLSITQPGSNYTLTAEDGANVPSTSLPFDVTTSGGGGGGASPYALFVTQPKGGTATFESLKLEKAGTYTLEATASGFATGESSTITITGGAVKKAIFSPEPANLTAATPFNVAVELTDAYGNEAGDGDTIALALQSHPKGSTLAGDLTTTVSDGVADFDDLTLATAGNYSLKATAAKAKATSKKFTVT